MIAAGRLNRRVSIERPERVPNGSGGFTKGWSAPVAIRAEMIPLRGGEAVAHALQRSMEVWKVTIRWRADLDTTCRLVYDGQPLNIRTCVDPDGRREDLVMTCEGGVKT